MNKEQLLKIIDEARRTGQDPYAVAAAERAGIPLSQVTKKQRDEIKRELYHMLYSTTGVIL